jgi:hypothetical protein
VRGRRRSLLPLLAAALIASSVASAHPTGSHTGFVSTVSTIDPPLHGLLVRVIGGHEHVSVTNLTDKSIVIFDAEGDPLVRIAPRETEVWREPRVGATDEPPEREGLVRNWRIPGTADGERFEIVGFLGYRPPPGASGPDERSRWTIVLAAAFGALVIAAGVALPLMRRDKAEKARGRT